MALAFSATVAFGMTLMLIIALHEVVSALRAAATELRRLRELIERKVRP